MKLILHFSSIVYLNKGQTLFAPGFNDQYVYIVLFGNLRLYRQQYPGSRNMVMVPYGLTLNIGWTIGEEILFKPENEMGISHRTDVCKA